MIRTAFFICGLCWMVFGILAALFCLRFLFPVGDSGNFDLGVIFQILSPASVGNVLLGVVQAVGFCAISLFCFLMGIGLCSGFFGRSDQGFSNEIK